MQYSNFKDMELEHLLALDAAFHSMKDFEEIIDHPDVIFAQYLVSGISRFVYKKLESQTALAATIEFAEVTTGIPKESWELYSKAVITSYALMEGI